MQEELLDNPPATHILHSLVERPAKLRTMLGEWIDNSFDASANYVSIEWAPRRFIRICDDGRGMREGPISLVTLGDHRGHRSTRLGSYGIGGKEASLWIGGVESTIQVITTRAGVKKVLKHDWSRVLKCGQWKVRKPAEMKACESDIGTQIHIEPVIRETPTGHKLDALIDDLGYLYAPAIQDGKQIRIKVGKKPARVVSAWTQPQLTDIVETTIAVECSDGRMRMASVRCGIIQDGEKTRRIGITYIKGFRVVKESCGSGCGGEPFSDICGIVTLDKSWVLTKNKDDVSKHGKDLYDSVFYAIRSVLEKAKAKSSTLKFNALRIRAEQMINRKIKKDTSRTRKKKTPRTGKGTRATRLDTSDRSGKIRKPPEITIQFADRDDARIGNYDPCGTVTLTRNHPFVACAIDSDDERLITCVAAFLIADGLSRGSQQKLKFASSAVDDTFEGMVGELLREPITTTTGETVNVKPRLTAVSGDSL